MGVIGFSHGGSTTMIAALASEVPIERGGRAFRAAIAYYPFCRTLTGRAQFATDTLILIGKDDDWTPAERCAKLVEATISTHRMHRQSKSIPARHMVSMSAACLDARPAAIC
jgi:dienelactone hydrolase